MEPLPPLALFRDWYIFYQAGRSVLLGYSPYRMTGYLNPVQVAWILAPTTRLPFLTWVYVMIAVSFVLMVILLKKRAHWALLSLPFIFGMTMGSLDVLLWVPARLLGGWGLPLLTLKPQLGLFVIPLQLAQWWREGNRQEIRRFVLVTALLWGIPAALDIHNITDWLQVVLTSNTEHRMRAAASLAGFSALIGPQWVYILLFLIVFLLLLWRSPRDYYLAASFAPYFWPSDWVIAAEFMTWRFTLLSWLLVPTGLSTDGAQFFFLLGILIWLEQHPEKRAFWRKKTAPS